MRGQDGEFFLGAGSGLASLGFEAQGAELQGSVSRVDPGIRGQPSRSLGGTCRCLPRHQQAGTTRGGSEILVSIAMSRLRYLWVLLPL